MGHRESSFRLTIATEDFLRGKPYYPPGASLMISGERFFGDSFSRMDRGRFGIPIDPKEYDAIHSPTIANLSATASEGHQWDWLTPEECMTEYVECDGLKKHRDLVLVVDQPDGWVRNDLFHLTENQTQFWNRYVPANVTNHLLFHAQCSMAARLQMKGAACFNACMRLFFRAPFQHPGSKVTDYQYIFPFLDGRSIESLLGTAPNTLGEWHTDDGWLEYGDDLATQQQNGFQSRAFDLSIKNCVAQPITDTCRKFDLRGVSHLVNHPKPQKTK